MLERLRKLFAPEPPPTPKPRNERRLADEKSRTYYDLREPDWKTFPFKEGEIHRVTLEGVDEVIDPKDVPQEVEIKIRFRK